MDGRPSLRPSSSGSSSLRNAAISTLRPSSSLSVTSAASRKREPTLRPASSASVHALERSMQAPFVAERPASALGASDFKTSDKPAIAARAPTRIVGISTPPLSSRRRIEHSPIRTRPTAEHVLLTSSSNVLQSAPAGASQQTVETDSNIDKASLVDPSELLDEDSQKLLRAISVIEDLDNQLDEMEKRIQQNALERAAARRMHIQSERLRQQQLEQQRMLRFQKARRGETDHLTDIGLAAARAQGRDLGQADASRSDTSSVAASVMSENTIKSTRKGFTGDEGSIFSSASKRNSRVDVAAVEEVDTSRPMLRRVQGATISWKSQKPAAGLHVVPRSGPPLAQRRADTPGSMSSAQGDIPSPPRSVVTGLSQFDRSSVAPTVRQYDERDYISRNIELAKNYSISSRLAPSEEQRLKMLLDEDADAAHGEVPPSAGTGEPPLSPLGSQRTAAFSTHTGYTAEGLDAERLRKLDSVLRDMVLEGKASDQAAVSLSGALPDSSTTRLKFMPFFLTCGEDADDYAVAAPTEQLANLHSTATDPVIREERKARLLRQRLARVDQALAVLHSIPGSDSGLSVRTRDTASIVAGSSPPRASLGSPPTRPQSAASMRTGMTSSSMSSQHRRLTRRDIDAETKRAMEQMRETTGDGGGSLLNLAKREDIESLISELRSAGLAENLRDVLEPELPVRWRSTGKKRGAALSALPDDDDTDDSEDSDS